ncbi:MAG: hypothetical protein SVZ03_09525 [Spirochaetota bacterium]|nr:hypothetical protein [Spirochaetota bacterium]
MNIINCDKIITRFLEMEDYRVIPLNIRVHMLFCNRCRVEVYMLKDALDEIREFNPFPLRKDLTDEIMQKILLTETPYKKEISTFNWVTAGLIIFLSIFLISYSEPMIWLKNQFGNNFEVPLSIVLGLIISIYSIVFIGTHLEKLKHSIGILKKKIS